MERILKKRFLMIVMSLMLVAGLVPMTAAAEPGTPAASVTVGGVTLNATNQFATTDEYGNLTTDGAKEENYVAMFSDGTLYLRDLTDDEAPNEFHGISAEGDITIDVSGDNRVTGGDDIQPLYARAYGIYANGDITITSTSSGGGNLTAIGGAGSNSGGIYSSGGDVTIDGYVGEITARGGIAATSSVGIGTASGNVIIYGDVHAEGGEATGLNGESDGICAADGDSDNAAVGNVYINGGSVEAFGGEAGGENGHSDAICADNDISITTAGEVAAYGGDATAGHSNGICSNGGAITINANVTATGGSGVESIAINVNGDASDITIEGGKVYAIGEKARDISAGINAGNVMIQGGELLAASQYFDTVSGIDSSAATEKGINGNVVVQPAAGKMIAVETGSGFNSDGIGPNITIYDKAALEGSPFTAESIIGDIDTKVVNIYTEDAPDVTPGTDDPAGDDQTGKSDNAKSGGTPETGDDFNAVPMVTLMALAAAVAAATVACGMRRKNGAR